MGIKISSKLGRLTDPRFRAVLYYMAKRRKARMTSTPSVPAFSPSDLPNLQLWLDPSNAATITASGAFVSVLSDLSGTGNHARQGGDGLQPRTGINTIGGKNVLNCDGNDSMALDLPIYQGSGFTVFGVVKLSSTGGSRPLIGSFNNEGPGRSGTGSFTFRVWPNGGLQVVKTNQAVISQSPTGLVTVGNPIIIAATTGAAGNKLYAGSGTPVFTDLVDPGYTSPTYRWCGAANYMRGDVGETIVYTGIKTATEINQIGSYLAAKWGLSW